MIDPSVRNLYSGVEDLLNDLCFRLGCKGQSDGDLRVALTRVLCSGEVRGYIYERVAADLSGERPKSPPPAPVQHPLAAVSRAQLSVTPSFLRYNLIGMRQSYRGLFPGYRVPFDLETDVGTFRAKVTGAPQGTPHGDVNAGTQIKSVGVGDLTYWYSHHPEVVEGSILLIEVLEPMVRYRLSVMLPR